MVVISFRNLKFKLVFFNFGTNYIPILLFFIIFKTFTKCFVILQDYWVWYSSLQVIRFPFFSPFKIILWSRITYFFAFISNIYISSLMQIIRNYSCLSSLWRWDEQSSLIVKKTQNALHKCMSCGTLRLCLRCKDYIRSDIAIIIELDHI